MIKERFHILIVDDMRTMRRLLHKSLDFHGYSFVDEAKDGAEAWAKIDAAESPYDLIICDWVMPQSSGLDLLKRIRSRGSLKKTPVIIMCSGTEKSHVVQAIKAGANGILVKPFTNDSVYDILKKSFEHLKGA